MHLLPEQTTDCGCWVSLVLLVNLTKLPELCYLLAAEIEFIDEKKNIFSQLRTFSVPPRHEGLYPLSRFLLAQMKVLGQICSFSCVLFMHSTQVKLDMGQWDV